MVHMECSQDCSQFTFRAAYRVYYQLWPEISLTAVFPTPFARTTP